MNRRCPKCEEEKPLEGFALDNSKKSGRFGMPVIFALFMEIKNMIKEFFPNESYACVVTADREESCVEIVAYEGHINDSSTEPFMIGFIKWDGCSNWDFFDKHCPLHFCTKSQARNFGELLAGMYDMALELMPEHEKYITAE